MIIITIIIVIISIVILRSSDVEITNFCPLGEHVRCKRTINKLKQILLQVL